MGSSLAQVIPPALAIALSAAPTVAVLLLLLSDRAGLKGASFLAGWIAGVTGLTVLMLVLAAEINIADRETAGDLNNEVKVGAGALMLILAGWEWQRRPRTAVDARGLPKWLQAAEHVGPGMATGLGVFMSVVSPKNIVFVLGAAAVVAGAGAITYAERTLVAAIFVTIASAGIAVPVVYALVGGEQARHTLDRVKDWLVRNNALVMATLLLAIGLTFLAEGVVGLTN